MTSPTTGGSCHPCRAVSPQTVSKSSCTKRRDMQPVHLDSSVFEHVTDDDYERARDLMRYLWRYTVITTPTGQTWNALLRHLRRRLPQAEPAAVEEVEASGAAAASAEPTDHGNGSAAVDAIKRASAAVPAEAVDRAAGFAAARAHAPRSASPQDDATRDGADPVLEHWVDLLTVCGAVERPCVGDECLIVQRGSRQADAARVPCPAVRIGEATRAVPLELLRWERHAGRVVENPRREDAGTEFWRRWRLLSDFVRALAVIDPYLNKGGLHWFLEAALSPAPGPRTVLAVTSVKSMPLSLDRWLPWVRKLPNLARLIVVRLDECTWRRLGHDRYVFFGSRAVVELSAGIQELHGGRKPISERYYSAAADSDSFFARWREAARLLRSALPAPGESLDEENPRGVWQWGVESGRFRKVEECPWPLPEMLHES